MPKQRKIMKERKKEKERKIRSLMLSKVLYSCLHFEILLICLDCNDATSSAHERIDNSPFYDSTINRKRTKINQ